MIPSDIKWDPNATPPQFTNNEDAVIEPGTHVRVKIIGTRTEVGEMWAIGSINGDFLGYVLVLDYILNMMTMLTVLLLAAASRHDIPEADHGVLAGEENTERQSPWHKDQGRLQFGPVGLLLYRPDGSVLEPSLMIRSRIGIYASSMLLDYWGQHPGLFRCVHFLRSCQLKLLILTQEHTHPPALGWYC